MIMDLAIMGLFYFVFCRFFLGGEMHNRTTGFIIAAAAVFVTPIKVPTSASFSVASVMGLHALFAFLQFLILLAGTHFFLKTANKYNTTAEPVSWLVAAKVAGLTAIAVLLTNLALIPVLQPLFR